MSGSGAGPGGQLIWRRAVWRPASPVVLVEAVAELCFVCLYLYAHHDVDLKARFWLPLSVKLRWTGLMGRQGPLTSATGGPCQQAADGAQVRSAL